VGRCTAFFEILIIRQTAGNLEEVKNDMLLNDMRAHKKVSLYNMDGEVARS
jgi:hypothetical protein